MKAKDTVMNVEEMDDYRKAADYLMGVALSSGDGFLLRAIKTLMDNREIPFRAGIKEVVDWVKENGQIRTWADFGEFGQGIISKYCLSEEGWQAKLKEWGI